MQIRINKEIKNYTERIFFGLTLRQLTFSAIACALAVFCYINIKPRLGNEITSWICILIALPFAGLGFVSFQGMNFEKIIYIVLFSLILSKKKLINKPYNLYYEILHPIIIQKRKEAIKGDKHLLKILKKEQRENQYS